MDKQNLEKRIFEFDEFMASGAYDDGSKRLFLIVYPDGGAFWVSVPLWTEGVAKDEYEYIVWL